jgi:hypothetical protein
MPKDTRWSEAGPEISSVCDLGDDRGWSFNVLTRPLERLLSCHLLTSMCQATGLGVVPIEDFNLLEMKQR